MKYSKNQEGIALVMVLVVAAMALAIVSSLLYMVTQGTRLSSAHRIFRTADEASSAGLETAKQYLEDRGLLNILGAGKSAGCDCGDPLDSTDNIDLMTNLESCRCDKLCEGTSLWPTSGTYTCDENTAPGLQVDMDPTVNPDFQYTLGVNPNTFDVFGKIVDTVEGNSALSAIVTGGTLGGNGVVAATTGIINPPHSPYMYRVEIQAQRTTNARERSSASIMYSY
ncbi:hypothetical protein BMS3Abin07_01976 [bacterium BMS3Abin07]|nr:hypothetical protein BMS3Abin07_01976 [bacterium BMS3Abin07]GBE32421.1 hypothetical protein BMS3Bbin05_01336 [bacterium BMS3Bbin05]HDO23360.1 hypothetical protein [Nitrospirota bacterium]HDZ89005.1 hypothetical protein [Nitrospirota bacterium]